MLKTKIKIRIISFILTVTTLVMSLPLYAYTGVFGDKDSSKPFSLSLGQNASAAEAYVLSENESLRSERMKHFLLSDGSSRAVVYSQAVHYLDDNGKWEDIDNTLAYDGGEYTTGNRRKIKFANKSASSGLVSIHDGDYKIDFTPVGASKTSVVIENPQKANGRSFEDVSRLEALTSTATYENIYDGVDIEYVLSGNDLKENIIVKEKKSSYTFSFELNLGGLSAVLDGGKILLLDAESEEARYEVPLPFMYDADYAYSEGVTFELTQKSKWKYVLTVVADAEWINAAEREFPVTIDPQVVYSGDLFAGEDVTLGETAIISGSTGALSTLSVGAGRVAYWKTNEIYNIPDNSQITNAEFIMHLAEVPSNTEVRLGIHRVTTYWSEETFCTNLYNEGAGQIESSVYSTVFEFGDSLPGESTWDVTGIVRAWHEGRVGNCGFAVKEVGNEITSPIKYHSSECTSSDLKPRLVISYSKALGLEDYWSYTSQSVGLAGTGYVNNATGKLTFTIGTISTADSLFGFSPTFIYNQRYREDSTPTYNPLQQIYFQEYSSKFTLNIEEYVYPDSYLNELGDSATCYGFFDSDGTEHTFFPHDEDGETVYRDSDGLLLTLEALEDGYTVTDLNGTVKKFTNRSSGEAYLDIITDKNGNRVQMEKNSSGDVCGVYVYPSGSSVPVSHISFVNKSNGQFGKIVNYDEDGNENRWAELYHSGVALPRFPTFVVSNLSKIIFGHTENGVSVEDAVVTYTYTSDGRLASAYDQKAKYKVAYEYEGNNVSRVTEYSGEDLVAGQSVSFAYYDGYTETRSSGSDDIYGNEDDIITVHVYDQRGRIISTYITNATRTALYGAASGIYEDGELTVNKIKSSTVIGSGEGSSYLVNGGFESGSFGWESENMSLVDSPFENGGRKAISFVESGSSSVSQYVYLESGIYTFAAEVYTLDAEGVELVLSATSMSDSGVYTERVPINTHENDGGFITARLAFEIDEEWGDGFKLEISAVGASASSTVCIDNVVLHRGEWNRSYSLVEFGNFEYFSMTSSALTLAVPTDYWTFESGAEGVSVPFITNSGGLFGNSLYIVDGTATQTVYQSASPSQNADASIEYTFVLSAFAKATGAVADEGSSFAVKLNIVYGEGEAEVIVPVQMDFLHGCDDWQLATATFTASMAEYITRIELTCEYTGHVGSALFDNIYLSRTANDGEVRNEYYDNGLLKARRSGYYTEHYEYDESSRLVRVINDNGELVDYVYDARGNVVCEILNDYEYSNDAEGESSDSSIVKTPKRVTEYEYNIYGQMLGSDTYEVVQSDSGGFIEKPGTKHITSSSEYVTDPTSRIFGAMVAVTDTLGNRTQYFYDTADGYLIATISPDGNGLCYTYDGIGSITSVRPALWSATNGYLPIEDSALVEYEYDSRGMLSSITTPTTEYGFTYNVFGQRDGSLVGGDEIAAYEYNENGGKLNKILYGNGFYERYVYDSLDRVIEIWYNNGDGEERAFGYSYTAEGELYRYDDYLGDTAIIYSYDLEGRMIGFTEFDTETAEIGDSLSYEYNGDGLVGGIYHVGTFDYGGSIAEYFAGRQFEYTSNGLLTRQSVDTVALTGGIEYTYDEYDRLISKSTNLSTTYANYSGRGHVSSESYEYLTVGDNTSALVSSYTFSIDRFSLGETRSRSYTYTYDELGNITSVTDSGYLYTYEAEEDQKYNTTVGVGGASRRYFYDSLSQLIREDVIEYGYTAVYTYDDAGNIQRIRRYALTDANAEPTGEYTEVVFGYANAEWADQLTSVNGSNITYDEIGNPLEYYNGYTFTWENGRELSSVTLPNGTVATYTYNDAGIRTSKTVDGVRRDYILDGDRIIGEKRGEGVLLFIYDASGAPIGMQYRYYPTSPTADTYWFEKNMQGDVLAIYDFTGRQIYNYEYDAWGNVINNPGSIGSSIGRLNPFRYRGYYYDVETGLYYVSSRYYDPEIGRWINADNGFYLEGNGDPISFNLFAYCMNNPVNRVDPTGNWSIWATVGVVVGAAICIAAVTVLTCGVGTATLAGAVAVGAAKGALIGAAAGTLVGGGIGYAATGTLEGAIEGAAIGFGVGAVVGAVAGAKAGAGSWYNSMAQEFTNVGSNEVVLGRSGTYEAVAESRGSTYFHTTDARWTEVHDMFGVGDKGMWNINKAFLNQQISAGSTFALANNPATSGGYYFMKEVAYLTSKGISMLPIF